MKRKRKRNPQPQLSQPESDPYSFFTALTQTAVSQICHSLGFTSTRLSALKSLTQITALYLQTLSKFAISSSNTSGRTQSNILDVVNALHDVILPVNCFLPGATPSSNRNNECFLLGGVSVGLIKQLVQFVRFSEEIPFAKPIPRRRRDFSFVQFCPETTSFCDSHVPKWLPRFPDARVVPDSGSFNRRVVLWEDSDSVRAGSCVQGGLKARGGIGMDGGDLAMERRRVSFKISAS